MPCPPPVSRPRLPSPSFPDGQSSPGDVLPSVPRPAHAAPSAGAPGPTPVSPVGLCHLPISHGKLSLVSAPSAWSSHRDAAPLSSLDCEPGGQSPAPSRWPGRWPGVSRANEFQTRPCRSFSPWFPTSSCLAGPRRGLSFRPPSLLARPGSLVMLSSIFFSLNVFVHQARISRTGPLEEVRLRPQLPFTPCALGGRCSPPRASGVTPARGG